MSLGPGSTDDSLTDCAFLVHADPRQVVPLLAHATSTQAKLAAAVYRTSLHEHRGASPGVRRQLLSLDAARWGSPELAERFAAVPVAGEPEPRWQVMFATGTSVNAPLLFQFDGAEQGRAAAVFELDGCPVAVHGGIDGIRIWDLTTGEPVDQLPGALAGIRHVVTIADLGTRQLALVEVFADYDDDDEYDESRRLQVWDLTTGQPICEPFDGPESYLAATALTSCDGDPVVVTYTSGEPVTVWPGGQPLFDPEDDNVSVACATVAGQPVVVTARVRTLQVWRRTGDAWTCDLTIDHPGWFGGVAVSELDGRPVVLTGSAVDIPGDDSRFDHQLRIWDLATGEPIGRPLSSGHDGYVDELASVVVAGRTVALTRAQTDSTARLWDLTSGAQLGRALTAHRSPLAVAAIGEVNGRLFAVTGDIRDHVCLWDLTADDPSGDARANQPPPGYANAPTITGTWNDGLQVRDLPSGEPIGLPFAAQEMLTIQAAAHTTLNGRPIVLIAGEEDAAVRRWDLLSGQPLQPLLSGGESSEPWIHGAEPMLTVACTELAGRAVAVAGGESAELWVWDLATGEPIGKPMTGHLKWSWEAIGQPGLGTKLYITALACTHLDGRPIAVTGGEDGTVRRWDLATGQQLGDPPVAGPLSDRKNEAITAVACAELDGRAVMIGGSQEHTVRLWDLATGDQLGAALTFPDPVSQVSAAPDGNLVIGFGSETAVLKPKHQRRAGESAAARCG